MHAGHMCSPLNFRRMKWQKLSRKPFGRPDLPARLFANQLHRKENALPTRPCEQVCRCDQFELSMSLLASVLDCGGTRTCSARSGSKILSESPFVTQHVFRNSHVRWQLHIWYGRLRLNRTMGRSGQAPDADSFETKPIARMHLRVTPTSMRSACSCGYGKSCNAS